MIIKNVEFVVSAVNPSQYPTDTHPEIVLTGRSNVGKSSFINALLNHSKLARVSATPGKTRLINFFRINHSFYFVDIPGYGYANVSQEMKVKFQKYIETYFESSSKIKLVIQLLDIRHLPTADDLLMISYLKSKNIKILYVFTKSDKLSNNQRQKSLKGIFEKLQLTKEDTHFIFSSVTKLNREEILNYLDTIL
ncbi:MAG: ribosome biogenesis GTP-binding protein YihA/YsxC [Candidatus Izemoplasmatales bacterium]